MRQVIVCMSCSAQAGCVISGVEKLCKTCKKIPICHLLESCELTTEKFVTCQKCSERASRNSDYD